MMAGPVGYPDYQRLVTVDSPTLVSASATLHEAPLDLGPFDVSRYQRLVMNVGPNRTGALPFTVGAFWSSDELGLNHVGERFVTVLPIAEGPSHSTLECGIVNLGPWLRLELTAGEAGAWRVAYTFGADNRNPALGAPIREPVLAGQESHSVASGVKTFVYPKYYYEGYVAGSFIVGSNAAGTVSLEVYDQAAKAWLEVHSITGPAKTEWVQYGFHVPLGAWRLSLSQSSGSSQAFIIGMTPSATGSN